MFESEVKVTVTEKEAPFAPKDQLGDYVLHRWTWREKQQASMKSTKILDQRRQIVETDVVEYEVQMLLSCLKAAPFDVTNKEITYEKLSQLDPAVGDAVIKACRSVNSLTTVEQADFLGPSEPKKDTNGSPSTGPAPT